MHPLIAKNVSLLCVYIRERETHIFAIYGGGERKGHYENRRPCVLYTRSVVRRPSSVCGERGAFARTQYSPHCQEEKV